MFTIFLCDDNADERAYVKNLVFDWSARSGAAVRLQEYPSAETLLFAYADCPPDILLLDIEMPGRSGVELAKHLRQGGDKLLQIIFITAYSDYIAEGYDVAALHYLLKPVSREKLFSVLSRAVERIADDGKKLLLKLPEETALVPVRDISHIEAEKNYITVHAGRDYTLKMPLKEMEAELDDRFLRIGRSYIVNLSFITRVTRSELFLKGRGTIPLPRSAYEKVNRAIIAKRPSGKQETGNIEGRLATASESFGLS